MAKRAPKVDAHRARPAAAADKAAADLAALRPDITIPVGGEQVTVREYDFWTAMSVVYADRAFLDDCAVLLAANAQDAWEAVRSLIGRHRNYLQQAVATATGRDVAWVTSLPPRDTDTLLSTWWAVNGHFFVREATVVLRGQLARERASSGQTSSSSSPAPATAAETSIASADTPDVSST